MIIKLFKGSEGHSIERYNVHGGVSVNNYLNEYSNNKRFKKGAYAIEPFISYKNNKYYSGKTSNNYRVSNDNMELYKYFNNLIFTDSHIKYYDINNIFQNEKHNLNYYPPLKV